MANIQIQEFPLFTTPASPTDIVHAKQGGNDKRLTIAQLRGEVGSVGNAYTATGVNGITLVAKGNSVNASEYFDGQAISFRAVGDNTSSVTLNINGLGNRNLYLHGIPLVAGTIQNGHIVIAEYSSANSRFDMDICETLFSEIGGRIISTHTEINYLTGLTENVQGRFNALGTIATQNANNVSITGGNVTGLTSFSTGTATITGTGTANGDWTWSKADPTLRISAIGAEWGNLWFNNLTTGYTGSDGWSIGVDPSGNFRIFGYENTSLVFNINASHVGSAYPGGNWLIGDTSVVPLNGLLLYKGSAAGNYLQIASVATGNGVADGLLVGIDSSGNAGILNYEATDLLFYTNGALTGKVSANSNWLISDSDIVPNNKLVIYENSATTTFLQIGNSNSGITSTDGLRLGVSSLGTCTISRDSDLIFAAIATNQWIMAFDGGFYRSNATGGSKGNGTINAAAFYQDDRRIPCGVLEYSATNPSIVTITSAVSTTLALLSDISVSVGNIYKIKFTVTMNGSAPLSDANPYIYVRTTANRFSNVFSTSSIDWILSTRQYLPFAGNPTQVTFTAEGIFKCHNTGLTFFQLFILTDTADSLVIEANNAMIHIISMTSAAY